MNHCYICSILPKCLSYKSYSGKFSSIIKPISIVRFIRLDHDVTEVIIRIWIAKMKYYSNPFEIYKKNFSSHFILYKIWMIAYLLLIKIKYKKSFCTKHFILLKSPLNFQSQLYIKSFHLYKQWLNMTAYIFKWRMLCFFHASRML